MEGTLSRVRKGILKKDLQTFRFTLCFTNIIFLFSNDAVVIAYDWTEAGDPEIVVEDVERIDFDKYTIYDTQFKDWRRDDVADWDVARYR